MISFGSSNFLRLTELELNLPDILFSFVLFLFIQNFKIMKYRANSDMVETIAKKKEFKQY